MTDRHRFSKRSRELNERARLVDDLARMPDRATENDFRQAADLMRGAASDLDELASATPTGCVCRRIENDNYSYLDYHEECLHHRQYYFLREKLKEDYAKMEKALKDEARMKLVAAALSGSAGMAPNDVRELSTFAENVLEIADSVIRQITETA